MLVVKQKQVLVVGIAALVAIAGYVNWSYGKSEQTAERYGEVKLVSGDNVSEPDFFSEARLEREIGRSQSTASLQDILQNTAVSAEAKANAEQEMIDLARVAESESNVESMLLAKGFEDAVIYINKDSVTAIIKSETLESADVAKIVDVITTQTGIPASNIRIVQSL